MSSVRDSFMMSLTRSWRVLSRFVEFKFTGSGLRGLDAGICWGVRLTICPFTFRQRRNFFSHGQYERCRRQD